MKTKAFLNFINMHAVRNTQYQWLQSYFRFNSDIYSADEIIILLTNYHK